DAIIRPSAGFAAIAITSGAVSGAGTGPSEEMRTQFGMDTETDTSSGRIATASIDRQPAGSPGGVGCGGALWRAGVCRMTFVPSGRLPDQQSKPHAVAVSVRAYRPGGRVIETST